MGRGRAKEGFRDRREREPAYEDLKSTVTLAMLMGYKVIYDPTYAAVSLAQWPGKAGKNGGGYQYAFTGRTILASPTLPPEHGMKIAPGAEDFLQTMRQVIALRQTVGPFFEIVLG